MTPAEAEQVIVRVLARLYAPRSGLNAWQWGEKWVTLDSRESIDYQGPWDSSITPYVRFMMEFVTGEFSENVEFHPDTPADAEWSEFIFMKSSQLGFTLALLIILAFWISEIKQNALFALDSLEEMRKVSKSRLQPMLESCEPTRAALEEAEDEQSNLTIFLNALTVYLLGSHGKGAFRNKSVGLAILDELDAYKIADAGGDSHPIENARARLKAVGGGKLITNSSPETEEHPTAQEEETGTQHRAFVPCPHCDHFQPLVFDQMRFSHCKDLSGYDLNRLFSKELDAQGVPLGVFYECEFCHRPIIEAHKPAMLRRLRWRQTNPKPHPGKISANLSDLYSPMKGATWPQIVREFIEATGDPVKLANWNKNRMGKPSKLLTDNRTPDQLRKLRAGYLRGTIPVEPCLVVVTSDVQGDVKKWVKCGFRPDGEMYLIDWGQTLAFEELSMIAADPVPVGKVAPKSDAQRWHTRDGWEGLTVSAGVGGIDEGYIHQEVRNFCQRTHMEAETGESTCAFFPTKGRGGIQVRLTVQESLTEAFGLPLRAYHYSDDDIKKMLYIGRISRRIKPVENTEPGPPLHFPAHLDPEFLAELCSERLSIKKEGGYTREVWEKQKDTPNDFGDALKLQLVVWHILAPLFQDWQPTFAENVVEQAELQALAA